MSDKKDEMKRKKLWLPPIPDSEVIKDIQLDWPFENELSERVRVSVTENDTENPTYHFQARADFVIFAKPLDLDEDKPTS